MSPHKDASGPPPTHSIQMPHICTGKGTNVRIAHSYRVRIRPGTNAGDICTGKPNHPVQASLPAPLTIFSKSCLLFYFVFHSSSSFSLVLTFLFILLFSHISVDLPCKASGSAGRRRSGGCWRGGRGHRSRARLSAGGVEVGRADRFGDFVNLALILWWILCWFCE
jgi:hypothetical protein